MENTVKRSHVRAVARAGPVLRALAGVALALLACTVLGGCNKGTDPKPPKYLLYATIDGYPTGSIAVIDCETDTIMNYVTNLSGAPDVVASPDGRYIAALASGSPPQIFDAVTLLPIKSLSASGTPLFLPDAGIMLCTGPSSTGVYSMPDFTVKEVWHRLLEQPARVPGRQQVAAVERDITGSHAKLIFYDYVTNQAVDSLIMEPRLQTIGFHILNFAFSPNGERLYALGWLDRQNFLIGYDLGTRQTLFLQPMLYGSLGSCRVTPDGREVWVTDADPSYGDIPSWPQAIFIYDATAGTLVDTVSTRDISPIPYQPLAPREIRILPNGSKVYVACGSMFQGTQPILVINTATRRVERLIFGDFKTPAWWIDVAPRL